jgi:hypothetical protein
MRIDKEKITLAEHLRRANKRRWKKPGAKKAMALSMRNYWNKFTLEQRSRILAQRAKLRESRRKARLSLEPETPTARTRHKPE